MPARWGGGATSPACHKDDPKLRRFTPRPCRLVLAPNWDWHHIQVAAGCNKVVLAGGHVRRWAGRMTPA